MPYSQPLLIYSDRFWLKHFIANSMLDHQTNSLQLVRPLALTISKNQR